MAVRHPARLRWFPLLQRVGLERRRCEDRLLDAAPQQRPYHAGDLQPRRGCEQAGRSGTVPRIPAVDRSCPIAE